MEPRVVTGLQKVDELVRDHELQAFGRVCGEARVDADRAGLGLSLIHICVIRDQERGGYGNYGAF